LLESVSFLGFREDVHDVVPALDLVLLTSYREGLPLTVIEAMACGRPVVVTDAGGTAELVDQGRTGYVVSVGDWSAAADRAVALLGDRSVASDMGRAARERAVAEFSLERMVSDYEALYERCAARDLS
jgi:glycosyltransferase involved in cell wall biosynthesis